MTKKAAEKKVVALKVSHTDVAERHHTPETMLASLVDKGVTDINQLEKFMALYERWLDRKAREAFNAAMSKFQSLLPDMRKNVKVKYDNKQKEGQQYVTKTEYSYQDMGDIGAKVKGPLAECGLSFKWGHKEMQDKSINVWCIIKHVDGWEEVGEPLNGFPDTTGGKSGNNLHAKGSAMTYLERYTLRAALGLTAISDDDGQGGAPMYQGQDETEFVNFEEVGRLKPFESDKQFEQALDAVKRGDTDVESLKKAFAMNPEQIKAAEIIQKRRK